MNRSMQPEPSLPPASSAMPTPPATGTAASASAPVPLEEQLSLAAEERPADRPPDALQQARDSIVAGEWTAAMTTLKALIAREPKNARARAVLAELLDRKGDVEGALGELGRAIEGMPD